MMHTTIVLKDRMNRGAEPYICRGVGRPGIDDGATDAACPSFESALRRAKKIGCEWVSVAKDHAPRDAKLLAAKVGIELVIGA